MSFSLRQLASVFGAPGPWTTVYFDARHDTEDAAHIRELTWRALRDRLSEQAAPTDDLAALDEAVAAPTDVGGPVCRYVLAGNGRVVLDEVVPGTPVGPDAATHGPVPDVLPLVLHRSHDVPYLVVEAGRDGASVTAYRASRPTALAEHEVHGEDHHLTKVQAGGWSQRRYQQHAEEVWQRNAGAVADEVDRTIHETSAAFVVLTGDVRAREKITERLSADATRLLVQVDAHTRADGAGHQALDEAVHERLEELADSEELEALDRLASRAGDADRLSTEGLGATVEALQQGQVETLLLDPAALGDRQSLALDAAPWVALAPEEAIGTDVLAEVPAVAALLRACAMTDAQLLVVDAERLPRPDGVAALLRWPVGPASSAGKAP